MTLPSALTDGLVQNGFEKQAAAELIRPSDEQQGELPSFEGMTQPDTEPTPAARGEVFKVPKLMVKQNQRYLDFEASRFLEIPWQLSECDAELSEEEFPSEFNTGERGEIGLSQEGRVEMRFLGQLHQQMTLLAPDDKGGMPHDLPTGLIEPLNILTSYSVSLYLFYSGWSNTLLRNEAFQ